MPDLRVVLVDDHPLMLDALLRALRGGPGLTVVKGCMTAAAALAEVRNSRPEILVLDAQLPDSNGLDIIPEIQSVSPETRILVFTATLDEASIIEALHRGAKAVLLKTTPPEKLIGAIHAVAAGEEGIVPDEIRVAMHRGAAAGSSVEALSPREWQIAERVARGARNKEIAWELGISEGTVKLHIHHAFRKLGVGNRVGLSQVFSRRGRRPQ